MALLYTLEGIRHPILNIIALFFSLPGEKIIFMCALGVIFWCVSKKTAYKLFFAFITASSVLNIIVAAVHAPLPWISDPAYTTLDIVRSNVHGYIFPSNGIFNVVCITAGIYTNFKHFLVRFLSVLTVMLTVFSYIYLGMCTIWGAVAAIVIGAMAVIAFNIFIDGTLFDPSQYRIFAFLQLIPVFVLVIVTLSLYFNDVITLEGTGGIINHIGIYLGLLGAWYFEENFIHFRVRCDRLWKQVVKAACGLAVLLILYIGLTLLFSLIPGYVFGGFFVCLITSTVGFGIYPILIRRFFQPVYG